MLLDVFGTATFFGCVVLFILPPSGVVILQIIAATMICFGLGLGWAAGVIVMKAALATRPKEDLAARYHELQQSIPQNTTNVGQTSGQSTYTQIAIFEGFMLDTRVSVTYLCLLGLFIYLLVRLRLAAPKLTLVAMFAMVVSDVYLVMAPMMPTFQGTIPKILVLPCATAAGIGAACNVLLFPQSTSEIVLDGMAKMVTPMQAFVKSLDLHFRSPQRKYDVQELQQLLHSLTETYKNIEVAAKFLPMDFSFRRWNPQDISSLEKPLRHLFTTFRELVQWVLARAEGTAQDGALAEAARIFKEMGSYQLVQPSVGYHQIAKTVEFRTKAKHPDADETLAKTFAALATSATPLLQAWQQACDAAHYSLTGKVAKDATAMVSNCKDALESLREAEADFEQVAVDDIIAPYSHLFDDEGNILTIEESIQQAPPFYGLITGLLFQEHILNLSKATARVMQRIVEIEGARQRKQLWLPKGLQRISFWALSTDDYPSDFQDTLDLTRTISAVRHEQPSKRKWGFKRISEQEQDSSVTAASILEDMRKPSSRKRHTLSTIILALSNWISDAEGLHALRTVILTIALAIPAVVPASAGFYYREKGLWALVMGQLCLEPYTSDFFSGLIIRAIGTVGGGVLGLLCWYIGSGSGPGNPYGLSAIMAVAIVLTMWWRLFAPRVHMAAGLMLTATMYMVVAYSWVDTHIPSYGNPGVGYQVFWRRLLLVVIGFGAAAVITVFPRPPSGNKHYRKLIAHQISTVKDRYALYASTWRSPPEDLAEIAEKEAVSSEEALNSLTRPIKLTAFEFSTSNIDTETLSRTCELCAALSTHITQLLIYTQKLPLPLRLRFIRHTGVLNENLLEDIMSVLTIAQQALVTGGSLPAMLPVPLVTRAQRYREPVKGAFEETGLSMRAQLSEESGRHWVGALDSFLRFLGCMDDLVLALKKVVGEQAAVELSSLNLGSA